VAIYAGLAFLMLKFGIPPSLIMPPPQQPPPAPIIIQPPAPVPPVPDAKPDVKADPLAAIARIQFGRNMCSATVIGPRREDGKWWVLTASHCIEGQEKKGTMRMKDGRTLGIVVVATNSKADYCWCLTESAKEELPFARVATYDPVPGVKVWHAGYGSDKPANREDGTVAAEENNEAQLQFSLSVSPGDSGGGIFRSDTGELVSCVCCTTGLARKATVWGASTRAIRVGRADVAFERDAQGFPVPVIVEDDF